MFVPVDENSAYSIEVTAGGQSLATFEGTRDCRFGVAGVSISEVCAEVEGTEGVELTLTNSGDDSIAFQVDGGSDVVVGAGGSTTVFVPVDENSAYSIEVTAGGATVGVLEGTRDCRPARHDAEPRSSSARGPTVDRGPASRSPTPATTRPSSGRRWRRRRRAGRFRSTVFVPVAEDEAYSVTVTADGASLITFEGTRDCDEPETTTTTTTLPTEVGGVQNPQPLPRTGSESSRSLVVGLALLISGAGVVLLAADRRRAASR